MERQGSGLLASLGKYLTDRQKLQRLVLEILLEIAMVVVFLKAYNGVRNQFGSAKCTPQFALGHALQVIRTERVFGIFWEQEIQVSQQGTHRPGTAATPQVRGHALDTL